MSQHPNARTIAAIETMIEDMQFLVDHPRMQQRRWVGKGKEWLPILEQAKEDLQREVSHNDFVMDAHQALLEAIAMVGLTAEKRDASTWGYRWHEGTLEGTFPTQAAAIQAGLRARYQ